MLNKPIFKSPLSLIALAIVATGSIGIGNPALASSIANDGDGQGVLQNEQEIVISASRVETAKQSSANYITIIGSDEIRRTHAQQVTEVLRQVPGLAVSRSGGDGQLTEIRLRGSESNQTLVLIDGIEANDIASGSRFDFSNLLTDDVERIEIIRGPQSAVWGSDAIGGVINIITKTGQGKNHVRVSAAYGNLGTHKESLNVSGGSDSYNYAIGGALYKTSGISVADENDNNPEADGYDNRTLSFKGGIKATDNVKLNAVFRQINARAEADGFTNIPVDADNINRSQQRYGALTSGIDTFDGAWQHQLILNRTETSNKFQDVISGDFNSSGIKNKYGYVSNILFGNDDFDNRLTLSAEREVERYHSINAFAQINKKIQNTGVAVEYGADIINMFNLNLSGRRDINNKFQNANTYKLGLSAQVSDAIRLKASKGTGIKNPTMTELFGFFGTFVGNPNLQPEKTETWDTGVEFNLDNADTTVELTYFSTDVKNLIVGSGNTAINLNSQSDIKGVEFSARTHPTDFTRLGASYTYTDSDDGTGQELVRRPKHAANITAGVDLNDDKTHVDGSVNYVGKQDDLAFDAFFNTTQVTLEDYTTVNFTVSHDLSKQMQVYLRLENALDEDYEEIVGYGTKGINGLIGISIDTL